MAKAKFERTKPHVNVGTIGHVDHGKTTLTAAITTVLAKKFGGDAKTYDQIDAAPEEKARGITINTAHVEYRDGQPSLRPRGLPRARRLHQEHDHRCGPDGRRDPGGRAADGPMPQTREHILLARQVGRALHGGVHEQGRHGRRRGTARAGRDGRCANCCPNTSFPGRHPGCHRLRVKGHGRRQSPDMGEGSIHEAGRSAG